MTAFHGKKGAATFTDLTFEMTSWTINATADTAEGTVMNASTVTAATHWKTHLVGYKDWTATAECIEPADGAGIAALGTSTTLTLDGTDGLAYSGTAICTGFNPSVSSSDVGRCTLSFQGNGQLQAN